MVLDARGKSLSEQQRMIFNENELKKFKNERILNKSFNDNRPHKFEICSQTFAKANFKLPYEEYITAYNNEAVKQNKYTIQQIAEHWFDKQTDNILFEDCLKYVHAMMWYRSTSGLRREHRAIEWLLKEHNIQTKQSSTELDRKYSVDIQTVDNKHFFQVKPASYYYYSGRTKQLDKIKNQRFKQDYGFDVVYMYENEQNDFSFHQPNA